MNVTELSSIEILDLARQIEAAGEAFYATALEHLTDADTRAVFEHLREEEERHAAQFERLLGAVAAGASSWRTDEAYQGHLRGLVETRVFPDADAARAAAVELTRSAAGREAAIDKALEFERATIRFLHGLKGLVEAEGRDVLDRLIAEEQRHVRKLEALLPERP